MKFSQDTVHKIFPENSSNDDEYEEDAASVNTDCDENEDTNSIESEQDENGSEESDGEETDADTVEKSDVIQDAMERFVVRSALNTTLDITGDNNNPDTGIIGTNAGDITENVSDGSDHYRVLGHVIFNQVGSCLSRGRKECIVGNSVQNCSVQNLCSTSAGESTPLLQPEASLFPRHFYLSAKGIGY